MKSKLISVIILLVLLLSSCAVDPTAKDTHLFATRHYVSTEVTYSEPTSQFAFKLNMESTETELAKYYFEPTVGNKERKACIKATEKVLATQEPISALPEIYIFSRDRYDHKLVRDHKLYSSLREWKSVEYTTDVLLALYGEAAHYGTVFGYAEYLSGSCEGRFTLPSVDDVMDLSYLCFDEAFVSPADVAVAKEIACDFVNTGISQQGEAAFRQLLTSPTQATAALCAYYSEKGLSYTPSAVQYGYGGRSYDYTVHTEYATFYIANDWTDMCAEINPLITDGFLHADYPSTKAFFETNLEQMKQYQDLFNLYPYNNDLDIVFSKPLNVSQTSFYQALNHRIYLYNVDSLMHEYIHSLTAVSAQTANWKVEGFARYFSYYYDLYGIAFLNQDYNNTPDTPELGYIHEYLAAINRPIDMATDYSELENIAVYSRSWKDPNKNYITGSSFVQYLVKQYGEEAVINSIYGEGTPLPKTYAESVKEWIEYIESEYSEYSKYGHNA